MSAVISAQSVGIDALEGHADNCNAVKPGDRECNCHKAYGFATADAAQDADEAAAVVTRLRNLLPELEFGRGTHVVWRDWLLKDPENEKVNPHAGSAEFHAGYVGTYDERIAAINAAIAALTNAGPQQ